ncbi:MAG: GNAT family N-acetyltransferase [Pseudonocardiales bacterium]|nr:GNAT family N-acetyltransferase [Pseudonocardiales bacterium]
MVEIRPAEQRDVEALAVLMEDLDRFYGATDVEPLEQRVRQIAENIFEEPLAAYVLLAWEDEQLVGMAAYSFLWPAAGVTRSLYLKELYVTEEFRGQGIGALLMQRLCQVAVEHECSRVEWTTDQDNPLAEAFYEQLGIPKNQEKIFYRLAGDGLRQMAL